MKDARVDGEKDVGMLKRVGAGLLVLAVLGAAYLALWPVPVDPTLWRAPPNPGFSGFFELNHRLSSLKRLPLEGRSGPADAATGPDGDIYISTAQGQIMRLDTRTATFSVFADTAGRPLGLAFGPDGTLVVADARRGLLAVDKEGTVSVLADEDDGGRPIISARDVAVARNGTIYFSEASTKFGAAMQGGIARAATLDLVEHGGYGRVLEFDPATGRVETVVEGLQHAGGVALTEDGRALIIAETGLYRVLKRKLEGERAGETTVLMDNLPGFPANVNRAFDGTFWVGLARPRSYVLDALSGYPFLRKVALRVPAALRPAPRRHGCVIHFDQDGNILETLQDPSGGYAFTTGAADAPEYLLVVTSLTEPAVGIVAR